MINIWTAFSLMSNAKSAHWKIHKMMWKDWRHVVKSLIGPGIKMVEVSHLHLHHCSPVQHRQTFESWLSVKCWYLEGLDAGRWSSHDIIKEMDLQNMNTMVYFDSLIAETNTLIILIISWHFLVSSIQILIIFGVCCLATTLNQT